tara:strand:- start:22915 stop:23574 length:660 start_codon:yes stop_codon:yes gene_type:complete
LKNSIKSYSKARSRFSIKNKKILSSADENIFFREDNFRDFKNLFDNPSKLNLEIGFGDGKYLIRQALSNPKELFIGIEVFESGLANTYKRILELELFNIRLIQGDIKEILLKNKSQKLFDLISIFFPDPWPKSKHKKRRLLKSNFLINLESLLKKQGQIIIKTDWQDYAEEITDTLDNLNFKYIQSSGRSDTKEFITKYEEIALKAKREITKFEIHSIN